MIVRVCVQTNTKIQRLVMIWNGKYDSDSPIQLRRSKHISFEKCVKLKREIEILVWFVQNKRLVVNINLTIYRMIIIIILLFFRESATTITGLGMLWLNVKCECN